MLRFYISIFLIVYLVTHFFSLYLNMKKTIIFLLSLYLHNCFGYNYLSSMLEIASSYMTNPDYFNKQFKKLSEGSFSFDNRNSKDSDTTTIENTTPISTIISQLSTASISIPKCGVRRMQHTELIRNGSPTKPGDWPWHVALYRLSNNGSQQYICGGSIIDQYRVITAAHCVTEKSSTILPERIIVYAGKNNLARDDGESQEKSVFSIIVHPEFTRATLLYDIAILKLSSSLKYDSYVQPICLWDRHNTTKNSIVKRLGTVVGWGYAQDDRLSTQLMIAHMPVVDDLECIRTNPLFYSKFVTSNSYCAGFRNSNEATVCNGDSGSGMYFVEKNFGNQEVWHLRGLASLTVSKKDINICDPNELTVFTDVAQFHDFLADNV